MLNRDKWQERNTNQVLSLSANVFENIKGGKSSFTIHIGENAKLNSKAVSLSYMYSLDYFFRNLDKQRIHGRLL